MRQGKKVQKWEILRKIGKMFKKRMKIRRNWKKRKGRKWEWKMTWKSWGPFFFFFFFFFFFVFFCFCFCFFVFVLFCFSLLGKQWNFFGCTKNGNFHREKAKLTPGIVKSDFTRGKKSGKVTLSPQKNFPVTPLLTLYHHTLLLAVDVVYRH